MTKPPSTGFNQNILRGLLYAYYIQGSSASTAHKNLLNLVKEDEAFPLEKVEEEFESMKDGKYLLEQEPDEEKVGTDEPKSLEDLIMNTFRIMKHTMMEHMDVSQRLTLRKVCHEFREMVDDVPLTISDIKLTVSNSVVEIEVDKFKAHYQRAQNGCIASSSGKSNYLKLSEVTTTAGQDLGVLLNHRKLKPIASLSIIEGYNKSPFDYPSDLEELLEGADVTHNLKVKKLSMDFFDLAQFDAVVDLLEPDTLEIMELVNTGVSVVKGLMKTINPDRFKNLKTLITDLRLKLQDITDGLPHFDFMKVRTSEEVNVEDVERMIEILLHHPTLQQVLIATPLDGVQYEVYKKYAPYRSTTYPKVYGFKYPNDSGNVLMMGLRHDSIVFRGPKYDKDKDVMIRRKKSYKCMCQE